MTGVLLFVLKTALAVSVFNNNNNNNNNNTNKNNNNNDNNNDLLATSTLHGSSCSK